MMDLKEIMKEHQGGNEPEGLPSNILHVWQVTTWDLDMEEDILKRRRINIMFAVKHKNDGKINSHKWFF